MSTLMGHVYEFCDQFSRAWECSREFGSAAGELPAGKLLLCGMGGSACAGDIAASLSVLMNSTLPVTTLRGYSLPASTGPETLVVAVSYSGGTEETLSALEDAERRHLPIAVVTGGAALQDWAGERGHPCYPIAYEAPPRHALAWMLPPVLRVASRLGGWELDDRAMATALRRAQGRLAELHAQAVRLADFLDDRPVVVVSAEHLAPVARRWKNQLNENAKHVAFADELPEGNHNSIMGIEYPLSGRLSMVFLCSSLFHPRVQKRMQIAPSLMEVGTNLVTVIEVPGDDPLEQILCSIMLGDLFSLEVARKHGTDPTNIDRIERLKLLLA